MNNHTIQEIDLKEAYCMCTHSAVYEAPIDEALTYKSNTLPLIVDFDKFRKIVLPCGYRVGRLHRWIDIVITSFRGMCPGAKHFYCNIEFFGPLIQKGKYQYSGCKEFDVGKIFGYHKIELFRRLTEDDLSDKNIDWDFYNVGDMTYRWNSIENAVESAKRVIRLRFRNYGKINVKINC